MRPRVRPRPQPSLRLQGRRFPGGLFRDSSSRSCVIGGGVTLLEGSWPSRAPGKRANCIVGCLVPTRLSSGVVR